MPALQPLPEPITLEQYEALPEGSRAEVFDGVLYNMAGTSGTYVVLAKTQIDCALPDKENVCVDLFFDLEMQRKSKPGYSVSKRGIYYCCSMK